MFEQIDAEITDERKSAPEAPPAKPPGPAELPDQIRRELALIESRCSRLVAS
jgi:hypothetical protein